MQPIQLVDYQPRYATAFRRLNKAWIDEYFVMEDADYAILDHPQEYIIDKGGYVLVALDHDKPVGVCALVNRSTDNSRFELSKMAVDPNYQGKGIGSTLVIGILEKAKSLGATTVFLDSNTILDAAMHLYNKLGFVEVKDFVSPYERGNIRMEITLK